MKRNWILLPALLLTLTLAACEGMPCRKSSDCLGELVCRSRECKTPGRAERALSRVADKVLNLFHQL
jgi:hypothetical protein